MRPDDHAYNILSGTSLQIFLLIAMSLNPCRQRYLQSFPSCQKPIPRGYVYIIIHNYVALLNLYHVTMKGQCPSVIGNLSRAMWSWLFINKSN